MLAAHVLEVPAPASPRRHLELAPQPRPLPPDLAPLAPVIPLPRRVRRRLPRPRAAIAFVHNVAQAGVASPPSSATQTFVTTAAVSAGDFLTLCLTWNSNTTGVPTLSSVSGGGLTWAIDQQSFQPTAAGCSVGIISAQAPSGMANTTTITCTFASAVVKFAYTLDEWSGIATSSALDQTTAAHSSSNGTAWSSGATGTTTQAAELVIGACTLNSTQATWTVGAGYSKLNTSPLVTGASAIKALEAEYQIVAATGAQTANGTTGTSTAWVAAVTTYKAATVTNITISAGVCTATGAATGDTPNVRQLPSPALASAAANTGRPNVRPAAGVAAAAAAALAARPNIAQLPSPAAATAAANTGRPNVRMLTGVCTASAAADPVTLSGLLVAVSVGVCAAIASAVAPHESTRKTAELAKDVGYADRDVWLLPDNHPPGGWVA
jgi:hypothetical protein